MIPKCRECACPCILTSLGQFYRGLTVLTQDDVEDTDKLTAIIDVAQKDYIRPYLSDECFDELCSALSASDLATTDPAYSPLPDHWKRFLRESRHLLNLAIEQKYYHRYMLVKNNKGSVEFDNVDKETVTLKLQILKAEIKTEQTSFEKWLCANKQRFDCIILKCKECMDTRYCGCTKCSSEGMDKYMDDDCVECYDDPATLFGFTTTKEVKPDYRSDPNWYKRNKYRN